MKRDLNPSPGYTRLSHDRADSVSNMDLNVIVMHRPAIIPSSAESDFIGLLNISVTIYGGVINGTLRFPLTAKFVFSSENFNVI